MSSSSLLFSAAGMLAQDLGLGSGDACRQFAEFEQPRTTGNHPAFCQRAPSPRSGRCAPSTTPIYGRIEAL
jgi:hypothetical protein